MKEKCSIRRPRRPMRRATLFLALGAGALLLIQYALLSGRNCSHDRKIDPVPPRRQSPPPTPPTTECDGGTFLHTEMGGGGVVGGGSRLLLQNASACCAACRIHNSFRPRPRGRLNCTTWVYNADPSHPQFGECWFKRHDAPWADIALLAGGSKSWTTGIVVDPPERILGVAPTARSCGDDRWRVHASPSSQQRSNSTPLFHRPATRGVHGDELSLCGAVQPEEAHLAIELAASGERIRLRLNKQHSPKAAAWMESLLASGSCTNRSTCAPHCCQFYRSEAAIGVHKLPDHFLRAHNYDPHKPPAWSKDYWWGPPFAFLQGRLWHGGPGPWKSGDTNLPTEHTLPCLHRGTVELVGGGPDFLIAYADHPMMPPHNAFAHVVEADMPILDKLVETKSLKVQNWGAINATVFAEQQPFYLRRL